MAKNIRVATNEDIPDLLPLLSQLGYPVDLEKFQVRFRKFVNQEGCKVAVYYFHDKIVGLIAWSESIIFVSDNIKLHIDALVVDEKYRNLGIGKNLMLYVENQAKAPAVITLTSGVRREKDGTHDFYKALGYKNVGPMAKLYLRKEIN